jgi:hypothetical protein
MEVVARPALKYQALIDQQNLSIKCPDSSCAQVDMTVFRWVKADFSDGQSFLPNLIYDFNRGKPPRKNADEDFKCGMCALSFFDTLESAGENVEAIGGPEKIKRLLGYTHVAQGKIESTDGLASSIDEHGHLLFFEFVGVVLEPKFTVLSAL